MEQCDYSPNDVVVTIGSTMCQKMQSPAVLEPCKRGVISRECYHSLWYIHSYNDNLLAAKLTLFTTCSQHHNMTMSQCTPYLLQ